MKLHHHPIKTSVSELLQQCNLPSSDLTELMLEDFVGLTNGEQLLGVAGIECFGKNALLRSVAVASTARGQQLAVQLLNAIEQHAKKRDVSQLYLLTTDADTYFAKHGFTTITRDDVPSSIQQTSQFKGLCPANAIAMQKQLR